MLNGCDYVWNWKKSGKHVGLYGEQYELKKVQQKKQKITQCMSGKVNFSFADYHIPSLIVIGEAVALGIT